MAYEHLPAISPADVHIGDLMVVDDYRKKGWMWIVTGFSEKIGDPYHIIIGWSLDENKVDWIYATPIRDLDRPMSTAWRIIRNGKQIAGDAP